MGNFNILPVEIAVEIFTRLPCELILDCKLVSKTWRNLIQHPSFSSGIHLNRLINHSADSGKLSFLALTKNQKLYYFEYNENHEKPINRIRRIKFTSPFKWYNTLVGSSNGLICLYDNNSKFCICNPMTKEYVILPEYSTRYSSYWFDYVPSTNTYKIVILCRRTNNVMLYTLGSANGWRNVGKSDLELVNGGQGVFQTGAVYFLNLRRRMIVVFDLADENFRELSRIPDPPPASDNGTWVISIFGVFDGFLVYTMRNDRHIISYQTWVYRRRNDNHHINEQEEQHKLGWNREFGLPDKHLLCFTKSGCVLSYNSSYLNIYNQKNNQKNPISKRLVDFSFEQLSQVFPHKNTLVSLKELGEKDTKSMQWE